mmetsp:Transcript_9997/g.15135  ORF Transcript_9997/g.15135 Transcript_9997/m.15135 type:complete len:104 (-) Transcript_9997:1795-2106(-)
MYFPQTRMYYLEDENTGDPLRLEGEFEDDGLKKVKFMEKAFLFEGFVLLFDEGYTKSIYINSHVPFDKLYQRFFYIGTRTQEAWILLLVKAMAKYLGSYDKLS